MKDLSLLVWLSQLGLSVAVPPVAFILLAVWLRDRFGWGSWVLWAAVALGLYCAITGFVRCLRDLSRISGKEPDRPKVSFDDHE